MNFKPVEARPASTAVTAEKALSFISSGWREVRSSADADLQLLKNRANSFKNLVDRELENFLNSATMPQYSVPTITTSATLDSAPGIEFVKRLQPKLSEIRRAYSSPDFNFYPRPQIKINLSAIKSAVVAEVGENEGEREALRKWMRVGFKEKERERRGNLGNYGNRLGR